MTREHLATGEELRLERRAVLLLVASCVIWGMSFNWNKEGQAEMGARFARATEDADITDLGPAMFLTIRFLLASVLWAVLFPRSLRGWTRTTLWSGLLGGACMAGGMLLQHYGLSLTTESLSAFLTSLMALFTPIMAAVLLRHRVGLGMWGSVGCATAGVALMTLNRAEGGFDLGALLGLLCALVFSGQILVVDVYGRREEPFRFALAQFTLATGFFALFSLFWPGGTHLLNFRAVASALNSVQLLTYLGLTVLFATVVTFGIMFRFQPDTSPTRAALIYLCEPLFATAYAWLMAGRRIESAAFLGGALIIAGNVCAEFVAHRRAQADADPADHHQVGPFPD